MSKKSEPLPNLEDSLVEVNQLLEQMENGQLTLEQSLHYFERGISLIKHSRKILEEAEQKVQILIQKDGQETLAPYTEESDQNTGDAQGDK